MKKDRLVGRPGFTGQVNPEGGIGASFVPVLASGTDEGLHSKDYLVGKEKADGDLCHRLV